MDATDGESNLKREEKLKWKTGGWMSIWQVKMFSRGKAVGAWSWPLTST